MLHPLLFTPEAEQTFEAISQQLLHQWDFQYVKKFERRITHALGIISKTPHLYPLISKNSTVRKCIVHKNCSIFYTIEQHAITVICFWDNRQEPLFEINK